MQDVNSSMMSIRERSSDRWVNPERDLAHVFPTAVVLGAVMALDPRNDAGAYLLSALPNADREGLVRAGLKYLLAVIEEVRSERLAEVWDSSRIPQPVCSAIMIGAGGWLLHRFATYMYRGRLVDTHGGKNDPAPYVNKDEVWRTFEDCLRQVKEAIKGANSNG